MYSYGGYSAGGAGCGSCGDRGVCLFVWFDCCFLLLFLALFVLFSFCFRFPHLLAFVVKTHFFPLDVFLPFFSPRCLWWWLWRCFIFLSSPLTSPLSPFALVIDVIIYLLFWSRLFTLLTYLFSLSFFFSGGFGGYSGAGICVVVERVGRSGGGKERRGGGRQEAIVTLMDGSSRGNFTSRRLFSQWIPSGSLTCVRGGCGTSCLFFPVVCSLRVLESNISCWSLIVFSFRILRRLSWRQHWLCRCLPRFLSFCAILLVIGGVVSSFGFWLSCGSFVVLSLFCLSLVVPFSFFLFLFLFLFASLSFLLQAMAASQALVFWFDLFVWDLFFALGRASCLFCFPLPASMMRVCPVLFKGQGTTSLRSMFS